MATGSAAEPMEVSLTATPTAAGVRALKGIVVAAAMETRQHGSGSQSATRRTSSGGPSCGPILWWGERGHPSWGEMQYAWVGTGAPSADVCGREPREAYCGLTLQSGAGGSVLRSDLRSSTQEATPPLLLQYPSKFYIATWLASPNRSPVPTEVSMGGCGGWGASGAVQDVTTAFERPGRHCAGFPPCARTRHRWPPRPPPQRRVWGVRAAATPSPLPLPTARFSHLGVPAVLVYAPAGPSGTQRRG